jgi:hypothetical protein
MVIFSHGRRVFLQVVAKLDAQFDGPENLKETENMTNELD